MKTKSENQQWVGNAVIPGVCHYALSAIQNVISKVALFGGKLMSKILSKEFSASADSALIKAELLFAELFHVLEIKKENHGLSDDDQRWHKRCQKYFEKHADSLDKEQVKMNIMMARLADKPYVSVVFNVELNGMLVISQDRKICEHEREQRKKLDISEKEGNK